jgi:hypothetical protein
MSRRRLPFEIPPPRPFSDSPTAVRNRRYRDRLRQARLEDNERGSNDEPPTTTYRCICGWRWTGVGTFATTVGAFGLHARDCLFGEPVQVIVRRRRAS